MRELEDKKYSLTELKEILREQSFEYESALSDQKERLFSLVAENENLKAEIAAKKAKEDAVSAALVTAVSKAKEIEEAAKTKFEGNLMRLKVFESKLVAYYKKLVARYPLDENLASTEEFLKKMDDILSTDFMKKNLSASMFKPKNPTLRDKDKVDFDNVSPNESGFDLNEALNPTSDLESICKELGLMEGESNFSDALGEFADKEEE